MFSRQDNRAASNTLAAAQAQLQRLRQQRRQERLSHQLPIHTDIQGRCLLPTPLPQVNSSYRTGWESEALAQAMRASEDRQTARQRREQALSRAWLPAPLPRPNSATECSASKQCQPAPRETITLYPDLASAMLQLSQAAAGRLWLLLRHLDEAGRGWFGIDDVRQMVSAPASSWRFCSWRQLRNLLAQGSELFWQRSSTTSPDARIWLRSPAKVAHALGLSQLKLKPVAVPVSVLLEPIGTVRAHFYAAMHSSRRGNQPISRQTIGEITGVSRRSQHAYESRAGVKTERNWALGEDYSEEALQQRAWRHGYAAFQLSDNKGKLGAAGKSYVAWQLPNSYCGPHRPQLLHAKKRINRQLTDLLEKGITGNGERMVEEPASWLEAGFTRRYHEHGRAAAHSFNRDASKDAYWRAPTAYRRYRVWHLLAAQGGHGA